LLLCEKEVKKAVLETVREKGNNPCFPGRDERDGQSVRRGRREKRAVSQQMYVQRRRREGGDSHTNDSKRKIHIVVMVLGEKETNSTLGRREKEGGRHTKVFTQGERGGVQSEFKGESSVLPDIGGGEGEGGRVLSQSTESQ